MERIVDTNNETPTKQSWRETVAKYQTPEPLKSWWQIINTLVPYFALWALMVWSLDVSYWLTLLLAVPAAGFLVRTFIIFHDCGHGSFFKTRRANDTLGIITGILTFTPYYRWRHHHAIHHATSGNLDKRGGDFVDTFTVDEYRKLPLGKKILYQLSRNPVLLFTIGSTFAFVIGHRFPFKTTKKRERYSVYWTNLALLGIFILAALTIGWQTYLLVQLPILVLGSTLGVWMFYVQHQFEEAYWERHENWSYEAAALEGSSFYKLPKLMQWITGNIGFHHIHHLSPRIPNYNLEKCHNDNPIFQEVKPLTLWTSLKSLSLRLWDEKTRRMVGYESDIMFIDVH